VTAPHSPDFWIPLAAVALGWLAAAVFRILMMRHARRRGSRVGALLSRHLTRPLFLLLPVFLARVVQPLLHLHPEVDPALRHAATLLLILGFGWLLIALISVMEQSLRDGALSAGGARDARVLTRLAILFRILKVVIAVVAVAAMLLTFPEVSALGTSILASAGIAGIVLGIAARPAVENLPSAWDLRCEIRERLVAYLQQRHPGALPRIRATIEGGAPGPG
jgi:small-conductance mechanosensitive channel